MKAPAAAPAETDHALFAKAANRAGFTYYKGDSTIHRSSPLAAHNSFFRVRFNSIALAALTDNGKLPVGGTFPTGSLIVKELQSDSLGTNNYGYAVMEKLPTDSNQHDGWVWAEYDQSVNGTVVHDKGSICVSCHNVNARDKVRVFNIFP